MPLTFQPPHGVGWFLLWSFFGSMVPSVHIDDGEIAVGAEPDRPFLRIHLPDLGDIFALYLDVVIERHAALVDLRQQQGDVGFNTAEAGDAVPNGGFGHLAVDIAALFFERVR